MRKIFSDVPIFFLLCVGLLVYLETSIPLDFCRPENRIFSDQELIELAIKHEINAGNLKLAAMEMTASDFFMNHPECCEVIRAKRNSLYSRIFGAESQTMDADISVSMTYETNSFNAVTKSVNIPRFIDEYLDMTSCGKVVKKSVLGRSLNLQ